MQRRATFALLACLVLSACSGKRAPFLAGSSDPGADDPEPQEAGIIRLPPLRPPDGDASTCGLTVVPVVVDRPNFYFVLDASGSMTTKMPIEYLLPTGYVPTRYTAASLAIESLLRTIGHRVSYGLTLFPNLTTGDGCGADDEIFPVTRGDPVAYSISHKDGTNLRRLTSLLSRHEPGGLTPTAATLSSVEPRLTALPGKTYAFLLTDGAPNCALDPCTADRCTINIENGCDPPNLNCCDSSLFVNSGPEWCLADDPTVAAVTDLAKAGIQTYVIGMPGTSAYADVLDRVAVAGGTARTTSPKYYPVDSGDELSSVLQTIGLSVAISCDIALESEPPDARFVNVFFDQDVLPKSDDDGWTWLDARTVRIVGKSCDILKSGSVSTAQVVAGCPTVTR